MSVNLKYFHNILSLLHMRCWYIRLGYVQRIGTFTIFSVPVESYSYEDLTEGIPASRSLLVAAKVHLNLLVHRDNRI